MNARRTKRLRRSLPLPWLLLSLLAIAFILRVAGLGRPELGGDEGFSWAFLKLPFLEIVSSTFILHEPHPVGSYWLQRSAMLLMGRSEFAIRFAGVWLGMLAVPLSYRFARQLGLSRLSASVALAFMAFSPFAIEHSRIARMYGMSLGLTLASTCLMLALLARPRWPTSLAYALVTAAALYVHYYAGFVVLAQALYIAARMLATLFSAGGQRLARVWRAYRHWLWAMLGVTALYVPWLWAARDILQTYSGAALSPDWRTALSLGLSAFWLGDAIQREPALIGPAAAVCGIIALLGLIFLLTRRGPGSTRHSARWAALCLMLYLVVPPLITFLGSRSRGIFATRYLIPGLPAFVILVSVGTTATLRSPTWRRWLSIGAGVCLAMGLLPMLWNYYRAVDAAVPSWRALAAMAKHFDGDLPESQYRVALNVPDSSLEYYYDRPQQIIVIPYRYGDVAAAEQTVHELAQAGVRRVLLQIVDVGWDGRGIAKNALRQEFTQLEESYTGRWIVQIYGRASPEELQAVPNATFDRRLTLAAAKIIPDLKGNFIEVHLRWAGQPAQLRGSEKIYVHVRPAHSDDQVFGQLDIPFTPELLNRPVNSYGLRLAEQLPAGEYRVVAGIYDPSQPGMPRLRTAQSSDGVELARFMVSATP